MSGMKVMQNKNSNGNNIVNYSCFCASTPLTGVCVLFCLFFGRFPPQRPYWWGGRIHYQCDCEKCFVNTNCASWKKKCCNFGPKSTWISVVNVTFVCVLAGPILVSCGSVIYHDWVGPRHKFHAMRWGKRLGSQEWYEMKFNLIM